MRGFDTSGLNAELDPKLLARIEDAGLNASAPAQQRWLDGWMLRYSPGKAKRARCVNALAMGFRPTAEKLAEAEALFASVALPFIVRITPFTQPATLGTDLEKGGLLRFDDTRVMVLPKLSTRTPLSPRPDLPVRAIALEPFAQRVGTLRGSPLAQRQAHAQRLATAPVPFHAFEMREDEELVACGQFALEADLVGLYDVFTAQAARGRGLATRLCQHLLVKALELGAETAYLQVDSENHAARAVYAKLGFVDGYGYHYRTRDPSAA